MRLALFAGLLLLPGVAWAEDGKPRDYCPARPGLGSPACTIDSGRVSVETSLTDWTLDKQPGDRTDTILIGDTLVRIGLTKTLEAQIGWTPVGFVRERQGGSVDRATRTGDVTLGLKANLANPDGSGLSFAVQPFVTLPAGRTPVGAGDWGAGVVVPVTYDLSKTVNVQFVPEIDAAVNGDGRGRHFAASAVVGLGIALNDKLTVELEGQALRDADPMGKTWQDSAALSFAYKVNDDLQLDIGGIAGLNRDAPDLELLAGVSRRF
ncbi:transporter [Sphingomonas panacisoli]|uniref:Transporter n=1 Tax=Sphingomonas panacisoli TaxID=1813879 RepID=A0A5B8LK75_9SPHN|nr:transporter [Sphingomonas panacisoli]QDZ07952.1 transporter [Sphingomonas panacisoli]